MIVSPILAKIFLHYMLDLWFDQRWQKKVAEGETVIVRYADAFVVEFRSKRDAEHVLRDPGNV